MRMRRRYLYVVTGRNCAALAVRCLESVLRAARPNIDQVAVVDDDSSDGTAQIVGRYGWANRWNVFLRKTRHHALANQHAAWQALEPHDEDVIVFVDLDDALATPNIAGILDAYYDKGAWLTYGSYRPWPPGHPSASTCKPARPYPPDVIRYRQFRSVPPMFNHLRTISWRVLKHVQDWDLRDDDGHYFAANTDEAVMLPALELAGEHIAVVSEVLYVYTCDSPDAIWRTQPDRLQSERRILRTRQPKGALP